MKKRVLAMVLGITMVIVNVIGCGSAATSSAEINEDTETQKVVVTEIAQITDDVTITFWHSMGGINGEAIDYLVGKFNSENEFGITVDAQYQGSYDDTIKKLTSAQIGNMGADLVQIYDIGTRLMIDSGWVIPMQELIDLDNWDSSVIEENIAAYYTVNDRLFSMPFNSSTPIMYYNIDMFKAAGITEIPDSFEGIQAIADTLLEKSAAKQVMSLGIDGWFFEQLIGKQGLHYVDNGNGREGIATKVVFDENGAAKNILSKWLELYEAGYAPNSGRGSDTAITEFSAGSSAITFGSTASLTTILSDVNGKFEVGTAYFPKIKSEDVGGVSMGGGSLWALNNENPQKEAAVWEFIKFLVSAENQAYWNVKTGYFPITTQAHTEQVFLDNIEEYPQFMTAIEQLHNSAPEYAGALISVFPEARQIVEGEIENMLNQLETVDEAVEKMASSINRAIEDYNLLN
ncbi:MAG: ABC transporter substrate-binding protein [Lachnospiraceae bacterium]